MKLIRSTLVAFLACATALPAAAVTLGQIDDFEDGTTQDWLVGLLGAPHPAPPLNVSTGGPAGANDNYLQLTSLGGSGPGSRLTVLNPVRWSGDYSAAGIGGIAMDVKNLGATDLHLRLLLEDPVGGPPVDVIVSTSSVLLPAASDWTHIVIPTGPGDFSVLAGSLAAAMQNATILRIFNSAALANAGEPIDAQLGVDNIQAVPEAGSVLIPLSCLAVVAIGLARRKKLVPVH